MGWGLVLPQLNVPDFFPHVGAHMLRKVDGGWAGEEERGKRGRGDRENCG